MSVSNSTDFSLTTAEIVEEARRKIGIHADEEPLQAQELITGIRTINMMLKAWQAEGVMCWTYEEGTLPLVQGDADYVFGAGGAFVTVPFEVMSIRINRNGNDLPMVRMSREEYFDLPNKATQGYPTQFYYDRQRSSGTLYVWPAPDAGLGTLKFTYRRVIMDMDAASDNADLPQEWLEAIVYNLAVKLAPGAGVVGTPEFALVKSEAERSFAVIKAWDVGEGKGSLSLTPWGWGDE